MGKSVVRRAKRARERTRGYYSGSMEWQRSENVQTVLPFMQEVSGSVVSSVAETDVKTVTPHVVDMPSNNPPQTPPQVGERLLLLILTKQERVNVPGDLEEEYRTIAVKHGARYAKLWYYKQVAESAWPLIRKAVRWGLLASVGEWIRRLI